MKQKSQTDSNALSQILDLIPMASFEHRSRIHPLRSFGDHCFVKREDELGFGISGTKLRKYLSLLPEILSNKPDEAVVIGSAYSNHVLSFSQLLRENGIEPILFLLGDQHCKKEGNFLFSSLFAHPKNIYWIPRSRWNDVDNTAEAFALERSKQGIKIQIVAKGANSAAALPGSLTLAMDILRNEQEEGFAFDHLIIDSGTGLTACALALAFSFLKKSAFLHIIQVAGTQEEFHRVLAERKKDFETLIGQTLPSPTRFKLYSSSTAPAFGAVNATLFRTIASIARSEGFLTDPVFTAKLFFEGKKILAEHKLQGNILFIHSGGALGLTGFQDEIEKAICNNSYNP